MLFICNKLQKQWVDMAKKTFMVLNSIVKVVTKPMLTIAMFRFILSVPIVMNC